MPGKARSIACAGVRAGGEIDHHVSLLARAGREPAGLREREHRARVLEEDARVVEARHPVRPPGDREQAAGNEMQLRGETVADKRFRFRVGGTGAADDHEALREEALGISAECDSARFALDAFDDQHQRRGVRDVRLRGEPSDERLGQDRGGGIRDVGLEDAEARAAEVREPGGGFFEPLGEPMTCTG